ncbi:MAG: GMP synthase [Acidiferrobacterales bacterium]
MKQFVVVQHTYSEFLGTIENQLEKRDIGFIYFRPFVGQDLPGSAGQFDALFLLGGSHPTADREACPWVDDELRLIGVFRQVRRPIVAFGFGALLLAEHEGARISATPLHTGYWTTGHRTAAGSGDALAEAVDGRRLLVLYNGSAALPAGMEPIVVDDDGNWLAFRPQKESYGMLFRPEIKPGMIEDMIMEAKRPVPDNIGDLLAEARREWQGMEETKDRVIVALVKELDLMRERHKMPVFRLNVPDNS